MVTDTTNKYAPNGFCTISRAGSNETGENYIYDFSYYVNHRMLSVTDLANLFYNTDNGQGPDLALVDINHPGKNQPLNCQGYYTRLSLINKQMEEVSNEILEFSKPLMQAQADVTTYETGANAAEEKYNTNVDSFRQAAGFDYNELVTDNEEINEERRTIINKNTTIKNYLTKIIEFSTSFQDYSKKL
jgi:hypothetical protein